MHSPFKISKEPSNNYWYELNEAQKTLASTLRTYLINNFHLKHGYSAEDMKRTIYDTADRILESSTKFANTYKLIEQESAGLSINIKVDFTGSSFIGVIVSDIKVDII